MPWRLSVVWSVYISNDTKHDIDSTVDLVDGHFVTRDGLYGKKQICWKAECRSVVCVCVVPVPCDRF